MTTRTSLNFWLDLVSLLVMVGLAATGGIVHFVLPSGTGHSLSLFGLGRHDFGDIHFYLAIAALVLLAAHVFLHWSWICCVVGKPFGNPHPSGKARTAWGLSFVAFLVLLIGAGLWWASGQVAPSSESAGPVGENQEQQPKHVAHDKHDEDCPAGEAISGRTTLEEAAKICRMSVEGMREALKLPGSADPGQTLGRFKRWHGLSIHEVRRLACQKRK